MECTMSPVSWEGNTWSHKSAMGLINRMLSKLFPPVRGKQTSSSKRAHVRESNEKNLPNPYPNPESIKSPSLHPNREPPVSRLHCTALAAAFSFSNKSYFVCWPHKPIFWPMKARTFDTGPQHFWWPWRDNSPGPRSIWLRAKPAEVCLRCNHELRCPAVHFCWGEQPAEDYPKADFPVLLPLSPSLFLSSWGTFPSHYQTNSS
jgi:hypothetical protein